MLAGTSANTANKRPTGRQECIEVAQTNNYKSSMFPRLFMDTFTVLLTS